MNILNDSFYNVRKSMSLCNKLGVQVQLQKKWTHFSPFNAWKLCRVCWMFHEMVFDSTQNVDNFNKSRESLLVVLSNERVKV